MNNKSVGVSISNDQGLAAIQALIDKANELKSTLQSLSSLLGTNAAGPETATEFANVFSQYTATRGAIGAAQASIQQGVSPTVGTFSQGAKSALSQLGRGGLGSSASLFQSLSDIGIPVPQAVSALNAVGGGAAGTPYVPGAMASSQVLNQVVQSAQFGQYSSLYAPGTTTGQWSAMQQPMGPSVQLGTPSAMGAQVQYQFQQASSPGGANPLYSSAAGPAGFGSLGMGLFNQNQQALQARQQLWRTTATQTALYTAGAAIGGAADWYTQQILQGGSGTLEAASQYGEIGGTLTGAIAGALALPQAPGIGATIGAALGSRLGGNVARAAVAEQVATENARFQMVPFGAAYRPGEQTASYIQKYTGGTYLAGDRYYGGYVPMAHGDSAGPSRFERINDYANKMWSDRGMPELRGTLEDVAKTFSSVSAGLFAGGIDPESATAGDSFVIPNMGTKYSRSAAALGKEFASENGFSLIRTLDRTAAKAMEVAFTLNAKYTSSTLSETYTERIARLVGTKLAPEVGANMGKIFASLPETGGNITDILNRYGPADTSNYLAIQSPDLIPKIDPATLRRVSSAFGRTQREASISGYQARGSGAAVAGDIAAGILRLEELPDADTSELVARQQAAYRGAVKTAFEQERTTQFSLPMTHLEGAITRSNVLPFNPSNRFGLELQVIQRATAEVGQLRGFESRRRAAGQLSEDEELELESRIEGLKTREAQGVAALSTGMEDRLPSLSSGRPAAFGRFTSINLAAMSLYSRGNPYRGYGALNSAQKQLQEDFTLSFGTGSQNPYSRMQGIDNLGGGQGSREVVAAIDRLSKAILSGPANAGGTNRSQNYPPEARGQISGQVQQGMLVTNPNANVGAN